MRILSFLIIFLNLSASYAFERMVTHGYPACIACHVSPNGGGLLTDYGRSLSKELLSTWGVSDVFARPAFSVKNTERVKIGGDVRGIQTYFKNSNVDQGRLFPMQQNVELGLNVGNAMLVGTLGTQEGPDTAPRRGQFLSERHYILWSPTPTSRVRVGKFRQSFGINTPNHTRFVKSLFGFGPLSETYNLEYSQFYESYEVTLGASLGRIDQPRDTTREKNLSAHFTHYLTGRSRVGGSLLIGESQNKRRFLSSLNGIFPLGKNSLLISEWTYEQAQFANQASQNVDTLASVHRLGTEIAKGVFPYLVFEHASISSPSSYDLLHRPGAGVQWLPVPHFEIQLEYLRQVSNQNYTHPDNIGFVLFHLYI